MRLLMSIASCELRLAILRMGITTDIIQYLRQLRYFEGGISSVYLWDMDDGFAGCVLLKKCAYNVMVDCHADY